MQRLTNLYLNNNAFTGGLPEAWGNNKSFPSLVNANLVSGPKRLFRFRLFITPTCITLTSFQAANHLSGSLPASWFTGTPFPSLLLLSLASNNLRGSFPPVSSDCSLCKTKVRSTCQCSQAQ